MTSIQEKIAMSHCHQAYPATPVLLIKVIFGLCVKVPMIIKRGEIRRAASKLYSAASNSATATISHTPITKLKASTPMPAKILRCFLRFLGLIPAHSAAKSV